MEARVCSRSVLVVDDDPDIREGVRDLLESEGFQVLTANNGQDALDVADGAARPCVVLLDLMMPVMNGHQFLAARASHPRLAGVPVVVVSAFREGSPAGVAATIAKPFDVARLIATVARFCTPDS